MATALLTCPICSQPGFSTIESLRHGLISAATRQLVCPVCQDILLGLDKFTIHLFSHSVQHDYIEKSPLPTRNERKKETINVQEHVRQNSNDQVTQVQRHNLEEEEEEESEIQNLSSKSVDVNKPKDIAQIRHNVTKRCNEPMSEFLQRNRRFLPSGQFAESRTSVPSQVSGTSDQVFRTCNEYNNGGIEEIINTNKKEHEGNLQLRILNENRNMTEGTERQCSVSLQTAFQVDHSNVKDMPLDLCNTSNSSASTVPRKVDCVDRNMTEILMCEFCKFSFPDPSILEIHRQLVHRNGGFTRSSNVNKELAKGVEDQRQFACHLCQKAFKMRGSLMIHLRVAHGGIGGGKMARNQNELEQQIDIRSFTCNTCGKSFKKEQHLSQHVKTHEGKQWECDVCSKLFTTKYFLKKHKRLHTGEMPYSCMTCNKTFTFQQSYHKHLLYHSDEKPHVCSECDRAFKELSTLHNHQRIHTGEKPFACETCGKCFRQRVSYLVHRRIHTGVMPYKCTACGKSFRYKVSQRTHKCPSQPPGIVVRQSGDLVQKLLQRVAQEQTSPPREEQIKDNHNSSESNTTSYCSSKQEQNTTVLQQQQQQQQHCQQYPNNQFIILLDSSSMQTMVPSLLVVPQETATTLTNHPTVQETSTGAINKNTSVEKQNKTFFDENVLVAGNNTLSETTACLKNFKQNCKSNSNFNVKISEGFNESSQTDSNSCTTSTNHYYSSSNLVNKNNSGQNVTFGSCTESNYVHANSYTAKEDQGGEISKDKVTNNKETDWIEKKQSSSPKELRNTQQCDDKILPSTSNGSDLVVETTDFFTMVMSPPSVKSLPSPSEGLRHLTLSPSDDSCLLKHQEDGLYHFLVESSDQQHNNSLLPGNASDRHDEISQFNVKTHFNKESLCSNESTSATIQNESFLFLNRNSSNNDNKFSTTLEPLQTINEESLKQLLYGNSP